MYTAKIAYVVPGTASQGIEVVVDGDISSDRALEIAREIAGEIQHLWISPCGTITICGQMPRIIELTLVGLLAPHFYAVCVKCGGRYVVVACRDQERIGGEMAKPGLHLVTCEPEAVELAETGGC